MPSLRLGSTLVLTLAIVAFLAFFSSLWAEQRAQNDSYSDIPLVFYQGGGMELPEFGKGAVFITDDSTSLGILFRGSDLIRIFPNTTITITDVNFQTSPFAIAFKVNSGAVWVSEIQEVANFSVDVASVRLEPEAASTWISLFENEVDVFSAHHATRVSFLDSSSLLNDYLLTESHRITLPITTFSPSVAQLRYTKLTKEYPFQFVEDDKWEVKWTQALVSDLDRLRSLKTSFFSEVRRFGDSEVPVGFFARFVRPVYFALRDGLTLELKRRNAFEKSDAFNAFYGALYFFEKGQINEGQTLLKALSNIDFALFMPVFHAVLPLDPSYPVKELLREERLSSATIGDKLPLSLSFLRERLYEVYDLLDRGDSRTSVDALAAYRADWKTLFDKEGSALAPYVQILTEERQILYHLLFQSGDFYTLANYEILYDFEERILHLTAEEFDLNEERQAFVQDKIRYGTRLLSLIEEAKVNAREGSELGLRVIKDAETFLAEITQTAAVTDYFSTLLIGLRPKFVFVASPDFSLGNGTFDERYAVYIKKQADLSDLISYISRVGEGEEAGVANSSISRDQALDEALSDFVAAGVTVAALLPLDDPGHRLFTIQGGRIGLNTFEGNYDRISGIVYDLRALGKSFSAGVRLDQLSDTIKQLNQNNGVGEIPSNDSSPQNLIVASPATKLALDLAKSGFEGESGLKLESGSITLLDLAQNLFQIKTSFKKDNRIFEVTFIYDLDTDNVRSLTGTSDGISFTVESTTASEMIKAVLGAFNGQIVIEN